MGGLLQRFEQNKQRIRAYVNHVRLLGIFQAAYFAMQRLRKAQRTVALSVPGIRTPVFCRTSGSDRLVLWQVFEEKHFDITLRDSPQLIVDGGANVGYASLYFANKWPNTRIIAVEPDSENCMLFRQNCSAYDNIELIQGALWTSSTNLVIKDPSVESWLFQVAEVPAPTNGSIKSIPVADILAYSGEQRIDLLKLDIEGAEEQLFSSNYRSWIGHIENMMIEIHGQSCRDAVFNATKDCGFTVMESGEYTLFTKTWPQ